MRVPYNRDEQIVMGIMAFVLLLLLAAFASQIVREPMPRTD